MRALFDAGQMAQAAAEIVHSDVQNVASEERAVSGVAHCAGSSDGTLAPLSL